MTGYAPTHIRMPKNHADFERKSVVLFKAVLNDENVKRLGREGQEQFGVDLVGLRKGKVGKLVGIQCKKKKPNEKLTATEVRAEVRKALRYKPKLVEYIIVTTAPNDRVLDQLAQKLTLAQKEKGRSLKIEVWGWDTLEELINQYPSAKKEFDPGWSPALEKQELKLDKIVESQQRQATASQIDALSEKIDKQTVIESDALPAEYAEAEAKAELSLIDRRRGFPEAETTKEFKSLATRISKGNLVRASSNLRAEILERTACACISEPDGEAKRLHAEAVQLNPHLDQSFYDALLPGAEGDVDKSLGLLRQLHNPRARNAILVQILRSYGQERALEWLANCSLSIEEFGAQGALNVLLQRLAGEDFDTGLKEVEALPGGFFEGCPSLLSLRANFRLASILPKDQRAVIFTAMPLNPRVLELSSGTDSQKILADARADIEKILDLSGELRLVKLKPYLEEFLLWLNLEIDDTREAAKATVAAEIKNRDKTLRRVRLALAYDVPFNKEALKRHLTTQVDFGKWTPDEQFATFLLALYDKNPHSLVEFFDSYRNDLFDQSQFALDSLASIEIEALAKVGRFADARRRLVENSELVGEQGATHLEDLIRSVEEGNEVERLRKLYESSGELTHLRLLVAALMNENNAKELSDYGPKLLEASRRIENYGISQRALYATGQYTRVVELARAYPELHALRDECLAIEGWAHFKLGSIISARSLARQLVAKRNHSEDRELDINTSIESGDWSYLQAIVTREAKDTSGLDYKTLLRLARLAFESGSLYVNKFRDAAIAAMPDAPEVFLAAYQLSVDRGEEHIEPRTQEWFQKAVVLSGPTGPVQSVKFKEIIERSTGWNERVQEVHKLMSSAQMPLYVASRMLNRQPIEFMLGTALRNEKTVDPRQAFPVLAFPGERPLQASLKDVKRLGIDITVLFSLDYLGLLEKTIAAFEHIVISASTFSSLFVDRQFIRFTQPSEAAKANEIKKFFAEGRIKTLNTDQSDAVVASLDYDPALFGLLEKAAETGALVVRSAPVTKLRSLLDEKADMASVSDRLADTLSVLEFLKGRVPSTVEENASTYLKQVDDGWKSKRKITKDDVLYLDNLTVTYLHHVGLLRPLTDAVKEVYASSDVEARCDAVLAGLEGSQELLKAVERIRACLNGVVEKEGDSAFASRRRNAKNADSEDEAGDAFDNFPTLDFLSDLSKVDAVVADDRYFSKLTTWDDGARRVFCGTTLDILQTLVEQNALSENDRFECLHKLRCGGFHAVPVSEVELLRALTRAKVSDGVLQETPELSAIRLSLSLASRSKTLTQSEHLWLDQVRVNFHMSLRKLWSEDSPTEVAVAQSDWLVSVVPLPLAFVDDPTDEQKWRIALEKSANQIGMALVAPFTNREREQAYGQWADERLAKRYRNSNRELWNIAIKFLGNYLKRLVEPDPALSDNIRRALVVRLAESIGPETKSELFDVDGVAEELGIKTESVVSVGRMQQVKLASLNGNLRQALAGKKTGEIAFANGDMKATKLLISAPDTVRIEVDSEKFNFWHVDLLSKSKAKRIAALRRALNATPLTASEEADWLKVCEQPLTDDAHAKILQAFTATPEAFSGAISQPQSLNGAIMVPTSKGYFERLIGQQADAPTFQEFLKASLASHTSHLVDKMEVGVRRLAFLGASQAVVPFEALRNCDLSHIEKLLDSFDVFSLVFGFEICRDRWAHGERRAAALGTKFLQRIFSNEAWLKSRCEMFAACFVVTSQHIRLVTNSDQSPLYWSRLAALAHAGVLANSLRGIEKTDEFMDWAFNASGAAYTWYSAVDKRDEPRWEPEMIDPASLRNEIIGRCFNSIGHLSDEQRPKEWLEIMTKVLDTVHPKIAAFFPGPLDGFLPRVSSPAVDKGAKSVEEILKSKISLKDAPGLLTLAYGGVVTTDHANEIMRLLEQSTAELAKYETAYPALRVTAYIAEVSRDAELANAVISRCLRLITHETTTEEVLALFLVAVKACGANTQQEKYFEDLGNVAARFAFTFPKEAAMEFSNVLETLSRRDPRLLSALGQANLVAESVALAR